VNAEFGRKFWLCTAAVAVFVVVFYAGTLFIPLNAEDLTVYVNYFFFTGDDLIPEAFYGNAFGILPGEFVYKLGYKPEDVGGVYRPLCALLMALDFKLCGTRSFCYHVTNLLLQVVCSIAVLALAWLWTGGNWVVSLGASLLFSVHPTHGLSQVVMLQRADILCTIFYVFSLFCFVRFVEGAAARPRLSFVLSVVFFVLALMSKEMAASLPIALVAYDVLVVRRRNLVKLDYLSQLARRHLVFWALLVAYIGFRIYAFGGIGGYPGICLGAGAGKLPALMIGRHNITNSITGLNHLFGVFSMRRVVRYSLLAALFAPLLLGVERRVKFAILLALICMLPVVTQPSITPLYMYLSSAGFAVGVVGSLFWLLGRLGSRRLASVIFALVLGIGIVGSAREVLASQARAAARIEFAYGMADEITKLIWPLPRGARLFLVTPSMIESQGRVVYDPAIEPVLRQKANDQSLRLLPIPVDVERDALMELNKAAALDMEQVRVDERTYFMDDLSGELRLRPDLRERFLARAAIRSLPGRLPGDLLAWDFQSDALGWRVTDGEGRELEVGFREDSLVLVPQNRPAFVISPPLRLSTERPDRFLFRIKLEGGEPGQEVPVWVEWVSDTYPGWSRWQSRTVMVECDGRFRSYVAEVGKDFHWVSSNQVTRIRIRFPALRGRVFLDEVRVYFAGR